jgi:dCMP deaminase
MMVNSRIRRLVTFGRYNDNSFRDLFREAGIEVELRERPSAEISFLD